jgi:phage gpG-like protein
MSSFEISVTPPFEKVGKAIQLIKLGAALQRGIEKFAYAIERYSKIETPVDTGRLRASISTDIGNLYARISPHVVYAAWIHEGKRRGKNGMIYLKGGGRAGTPAGGKPFLLLGSERARQTMAGDEVVKELSAEIERSVSLI